MFNRVLYGTCLALITALTMFGRAGASGLVGSADAARSSLDFSVLAASLVLLIPAGLTMMAVAASDQKQAASVAVVGLVGISLGVVIYGMIGFGLQFGGLGLISDLRGLVPLVSEWSPVDRIWGPGWGMIGLDGFLLFAESLDEGLLTVFFYYAVVAGTAACIALLALARRLTFLALLGFGLMFAIFVYPVYGNWVWGGGWLSQLGSTVGLGHGFIDFAGSGTIHGLGGFFALAGILVFGASPQEVNEEAKPPPVHFPLLGVLGALLLFVGWFTLVTGKPLLMGGLPYTQLAVNVLLAACAGILTGTVYTWFVTGYPDLLMTARSTLAALVAISAPCPFVPPWAALVIGGLAGVLVPLTIYLLREKLRLEDPTGAVAVHGFAGLWGLLAVGIFADGASGQGWNGVGVGAYLDVAGQGVSGLLVSSGFQPDWPQQLYAQILGILALLLVGLALPWLVLRGLKSFAVRFAALRSQTAATNNCTPAEE